MGTISLPTRRNAERPRLLVSRAWADAHPEVELPLIVVDDTIVAFQRWAKWRRDRLDLTVDWRHRQHRENQREGIDCGRAEPGQRVYKSPGSFNNEIGLPYSLLEAPEDTEIMVLEMGGAYAFGELTLLAGIAEPQVGVVTNVYPVHLERMGTIEAIAETKSELVRALPADGIAILNGDDVRVMAMAQDRLPGSSPTGWASTMRCAQRSVTPMA